MDEIVDASKIWLEKHPYLKEVSVMPLSISKILQNSKVLDSLPDMTAAESIKQGVALIFTPLDLGIVKNAPLLLKTLTSLKDVAELPDKVRANATKLANLQEEDYKNIIYYTIQADHDKLEEISKKFDINNSFLIYLAWSSIKHWLSGAIKDINAWVASTAWHKNTCPVCDNRAGSALFKQTERGRQRFLHCEHCGAEWSFKRIGCPYCDNIDQKTLSIKECVEEADMRIDLCHKCKSYIKTYVGGAENTVATSDWATIHLDILMKDSGFKKLGGLLKAD